VPGLVLVALFLFTVGSPDAATVTDWPITPPRPTVDNREISLVATIVSLHRAGTSMSAFGGYAGIAFVPSFLARSRGMTPAQIGFLLAVTTGIFDLSAPLWPASLRTGIGKVELGRTMLVSRLCDVSRHSVCAGFISRQVSPDESWLFASLPCSARPISGRPIPDAGTRSASNAAQRPRQSCYSSSNIIGLGLGPQTVGIVSTCCGPAWARDSLRWGLALDRDHDHGGSLLLLAGQSHGCQNDMSAPSELMANLDQVCQPRASCRFAACDWPASSNRLPPWS